jgi:hypothetical protein
MERNVIIEISKAAVESVAMAGLHSAAAAVGASATAALPSLRIDESFSPVDIPAPDATARYTAEAEDDEADGQRGLESSTYLVRGTIEEEAIPNLREEIAASPSIVNIYADVAIDVCLICPGSPPLGTDKDVEKLLCVERLRKSSMDGSRVLVAIVDTGINVPYLNAHGKTPMFDSARSWVPSGGGTPGAQPVSHGTMCAYDVCIAAPKCTLLDISLLRSSASGFAALLSDAVKAYRHLLNVMLAPRRPGESRSLVVNNSWGMFHPSWDFPVGHPGNYSDNINHPFNRIVTVLERAGADILFAAGNCGKDCPDGRCGGVVTKAIYGANGHPQVLSVAGVDVTGTRVGYSSEGPGRLTPKKPDICGFTHFKGSGVYPADGGTSAATPVVAGVVAAMRSRMPSSPAYKPDKLRKRLRTTAIDRGPAGWDVDYGWGIINGCRLSQTRLPIIRTEAENAEVQKLFAEIVATVKSEDDREELPASRLAPEAVVPVIRA